MFVVSLLFCWDKSRQGECQQFAGLMYLRSVTALWFFYASPFIGRDSRWVGTEISW